MFTFGLFSTHIPYLAFVVFYAWILLTGVGKANDGKIRLTEHSVQIEQHVNDFQPVVVSTFDFQSKFCNEEMAQLLLSCTCAQQKWKWHHRQSFHLQDHITDNLFSRPPPAVA